MSRSRSSSLSSLDSSLHSYISSAEDSADEEYRLAKEELDEQLAQMRMLLEVVLMPFLGKWLGRRWSYWAYARWIRLGFSKSFFLGEQPGQLQISTR